MLGSIYDKYFINPFSVSSKILLEFGKSDKSSGKSDKNLYSSTVVASGNSGLISRLRF